jgi:hypothetical protein
MVVGGCLLCFVYHCSLIIIAAKTYKGCNTCQFSFNKHLVKVDYAERYFIDAVL